MATSGLLRIARSFPRRSHAPSPLSRRVATTMASSPHVIVLSSDSEDGGERAAAAKRARRASPDASPRPRPSPPSAARDAGDVGGKTDASPTTTTALPFDRCDPLFSCGFALTACPRLELEPGFADCNAAPSRGARLSDLVTGSPRNALVSNFMVDPVWLFTSLPALRNVGGHLAIAMGDDRMAEATRQALKVFACRGCLSATLTRPPTPAFGTHHSKFFALEYGWGVCVVVVTGNFIPQEYEAKTQALWFQKFPWKDPESPPSSDFEEQLLNYIAKLELSEAAAAAALLRAVRRCDFSSARADLVTSVPGNHRGQDHALYATGRLRSLLSRAGGFSDALVGSGGSQLVAQCSSLGKLNEAWLSSWTEAASGGTSRSGAPLGPPAGAARTTTKTTEKEDGEKDGPPPSPLALSIVWPTAEEVRTSVEGWSGGGSVPGRSETLALPSIARRLCRWDGGPGRRSRAVPHAKIYCRFEPDSGQLAWCLVGSANFSVAAWGSATKAGDSSYVRSWEVGVLLTPGREAAYRRHRHRGFNGGCVPSSGGGAAAGAAAASGAAPFPPGSLLLAAGRATGARSGPLPADRANFVDFYAAGRAPGQKAAAAAAGEQAGPSARAAAAEAKAEVVELPIPFPLPPPRYRQDQDQPWTTDVVFAGPDSLGRYLSAD